MKKQVRQYSAEEKAKIVIEAIKGELTIAQITSKYGVHATQISNWKKQGLELLVQGFKNKTIVPYNFCKDGIRIEKSFCLGGINNVDISCVMAVVD
ncbi:transposase [Rickettsia endosymbiont of Oedothorax gibbosus]|uniref:transposase n=1 Tax=Rickettsia endosymbiont of Oedothorax gibbosus TaxID=931099 RepID=UPI0020253DAF|nr:transposase [Rickettsia endosymbiont of Oedothorax gibbosus]